MDYPAILFWLLLAAGLVSNRPVLVFLFFVSLPFGALAIVPPDLVGRVNLTPASLTAVLLVLKMALRPSLAPEAVRATIDPRRLGLLSAFLVVALATAYFMPRIFAGQVDVIPMAAVPYKVRLAPTTSNFTQSAYMCLSVGAALAFYLAAPAAAFRKSFFRALLLGGLVTVLTGLADMIASAGGSEALLAPFRTANYSLIVGAEVLNVKRVVGLMPEASAYGALCVNLAAAILLLRPAFEPRLRAVVAPLVGFALAAMAVLSTSSTAYIGLGVLLAVLCASWLLRLLTGSRRIAADLVGELAVAWAVLTLALLLAVLQPHFFDPVREMLDEVIFRKSASSSYAERNMWSATALEAFRGTHGLGVGLGGVRTSNWFVSILSSTGVLGAVLLGGFLVLTLLRRARRREDAPLVLALQLSMIPWFAMQAVAGTTPDFGVAVGAAFGLIGGLAGVRARAEARSPAVRGEPLEPAEAYRPAPTSSR